MDADAVLIKRFADLALSDRAAVTHGIDQIFYDTSLRRTFDSDDERASFRHTWVGQYVELFPDLFFVALREGQAVGYLAGYFPTPGREHDFSDQHHMAVFSDLVAQYPAHLHINVDEGVRDLGIGGQLVDEFLSTCRTKSVAGVHIVTGDGSRNNAFYRKVGLTTEVRRASGERNMLFMGCRL